MIKNVNFYFIYTYLYTKASSAHGVTAVSYTHLVAVCVCVCVCVLCFSHKQNTHVCNNQTDNCIILVESHVQHLCTVICITVVTITIK